MPTREPAALSLTAVADEVAVPGALVTRSATEFAAVLGEIGNENEVLVHVKDETAAALSAGAFADAPPHTSVIVALPVVTPGEAAPRSERGGARPSRRTVSELSARLQALGAPPYRPPMGEVLAVRFVDEGLEGTIEALLDDPAVDYLTPNRKWPVELRGRAEVGRAADAGPATPRTLPAPRAGDALGSAITFHRVDSAWVHTKGQGAKVDVMDSGRGAGHPDADGIGRLGFSNDFGSSTCSQSQGTCEWRDDGYATPMRQGNGTATSGIVGMDEDGSGFVGVSPQAQVFSMKITHDAQADPVLSAPCEALDASDPKFCIEDDDFLAGVQWAIDNGLDVLSMSFGADTFGISVRDKLSQAYNTHDILLLAATPQMSGNGRIPAAWSFVAGVGSVAENGASTDLNDPAKESSGKDGTTTLFADCAPISQGASLFCLVKPEQLYTTFGGTSSATPAVAGIAALVRAFHPTMSAAQVRQRLRDTSNGAPNFVVDAVRAVEGLAPTVSIGGPDMVPPNSHCTWTAEVQNGQSPFTFQWFRNGSPAGTNSSVYQADTGTSDFTVSVEVTDLFDRTRGRAAR